MNDTKIADFMLVFCSFARVCSEFLYEVLFLLA